MGKSSQILEHSCLAWNWASLGQAATSSTRAHLLSCLCFGPLPGSAPDSQVSRF